MNPGSRTGIFVAAAFAIACGIGEMIVGYTGNYLGILATPLPPSPAIAVVGSFYSLAGLCLLSGRKPGAVLGIAFLGAEILGRAYLVAAGLAPAHGTDLFKVIVGGLIACGLITYIASRWGDFR